MSDKLTMEGERLVRDWLAATERARMAKSELSRAECEVTNTQDALARWMIPGDAQTGEKIAVWYGDSLIQVNVPEKNGITFSNVEVVIRKRGRSLAR